MGVIRIEKNKNFTVMSNYHLRDKELSLRARGLLSTMLSLPDEWDYSVSGLAAICLEGIKAVRSGLQELEQKHYLKRERVHTSEGRFDYLYTVYEIPQPCDPEPRTLGGHTVTGHTLNGTQISTKEVNTDLSNTEEENKENKNATALPSDDIETSAPNMKRIENAKEDIDAEFEVLWTLYPRKQGKSNAKKAYDKARKGHPDIYKKVEDGIHAYIAYLKANKTEQHFIKQGSTWFNQKCWEDDYTLGGNNNGEFEQNASRENGYNWDSIGINL